MRLDDFRTFLFSEGIRPDAVSIHGENETHEQYRISKRGIFWDVYYFERGNAHHCCTFATEDEAFDHLARLLTEDAAAHFARNGE